jgi:hypothetical protein
MDENTVPAFGGEIIDDQPAHRLQRKGTDSGNRREPRDVTPRKDLATFVDVEGQKKFTNRRKRTRLNKGGMFFNARDRRMVLLVAAHGWLDLQQLCDLLNEGVQPNALRHSLKRLVKHGLLTNQFTGFNGQILYTVTSFGLRKVDAKGFSSGVRPRMQTVEHTDALTALHIFMVTSARKDVIFLTERELNAAAKSGELSPRIIKEAPWTSGYSDFAHWIPKVSSSKGEDTLKRPDGYFLQRVNGKLRKPVAVEIERTIKSRSNYYVEALIAVATAARAGYVSPRVVYFAPSGTNTMAELTKALKKIEESSTMWPQYLPRVTTEVRDLDQFYESFSTRQGWIHATPVDTDKS